MIQPEDISIVGFNNIWVSDIVSPAITTVSTPTNELGHVAFELLYKLINDEEPEVPQIILDTKLIERKSVKRI